MHKSADNIEVIQRSGKTGLRNSNLELFRVIAMFLIVCHHYVVNSGMMEMMSKDPLSVYSIFFYLFGAWGKTGINCFVLITGYFMCSSQITLRKYVKLYLEIKFYFYIIWFAFIILGMDAFSLKKAIIGLLPFSVIGTSFTSGFMAFYLFIPFLNILVKGMDRKQHLFVVGLLLVIYSLMYQIHFAITYNYLTWFCVLYFISSYIRFYGLPKNESTSFWGKMSIGLLFAAASSIIAVLIINGYFGFNKSPYFFVTDSNAVLAVAVSVSSFMFFKNLNLNYSRVINVLGSATFGVFLIHTRGDVMRTWLWGSLVNCKGHFYDNMFFLHALGWVMLIYIVCSVIDIIRARTAERIVMKVVDPFLIQK